MFLPTACGQTSPVASPFPSFKVARVGSESTAAGERDISGVSNAHRMQSDQQHSSPSWYVRDRWGLVPTVTGVLIVSFVLMTGGEHGVWALWLAIPLLIIGLGYFVVVNAIRYFMD